MPDAASKVSSPIPSDAPIAAGLSQDEIAKTVEAQGKVFDPCYKILGKKSAKVKVKATVGPAGQVNAIELVLSNSKNAKMDACVIEAFKKIKFPSPHGNSTATITFPMDFGGLEQVP
jgi:TonB family protein